MNDIFITLIAVELYNKSLAGLRPNFDSKYLLVVSMDKFYF